MAICGSISRAAPSNSAALLRLIASKSGLKQDYSKEGKTVRAGVVYTRQQDANTPVNGCASPGDVMAMWKERFDLDLAPTGRIVKQEEDRGIGKCMINRILWAVMN